jgi:hypothetical protein
VAVALATDERPVTRAWLVFTDSREPEPVAEVPGVHGGGIWLDGVGRLLALDRLSGGLVKTVVLDLAASAVSPLLEIAPGSNDRLALADPASGLLVVRSDAPGEDRLGWGVLGGGVPVRFPECLHQPGALLRPLAVEPSELSAPSAPGQPRAVAELRVVVQADRGAGCALVVWRPGGGRLEPLPVPAGRLGGAAHWSCAGLRIPYSAPDRPPALATLDVDELLAEGPQRRAPALSPLPLRLAPLQVPPGARAGIGLPPTLPQPLAMRTAATVEAEAAAPRSGWRVDGSAPPPEGERWHPARVQELAGAAGPLEAVVYGGEAWLTADHLVLALHGGPADAWRLEFDPALQRMAAEGLAVVAPN